MRRILVTSVLAAASVGLASCVPPDPPPPSTELPAGIGVSTLEDVGGTNDPVTGAYTPSFQSRVLLDGVVTGPTPVGPGAYPSFIQDPSATPDGTARYPWNGFAGEGIASTTTDLGSEMVTQLSFPGGACSVSSGAPGAELAWISPSPDGQRVALLLSRDDGSQSIEIRSLQAAAMCPLTVSASLAANASDGDVAQGPFAWRPDSSAVMYMRRHLVGGSGTWTIDRLAAVAGAIPLTAFSSGGDISYPLGWSVANRLLVWRWHTEPTGDVTTSLLTTPATGGAQRVLSSVTQPSFAVGKWNFGYFVPGTTNVAMADLGGWTCRDDCPFQFPLLRLTIRADDARVVDTNHFYLGTASWHDEPTGTGSPPTTSVPNSGMIGRFVH